MMNADEYCFLIDNTPDVVTCWDKDLKLTFANKALEDKTGIPNAMLYGKTKLDMGQPNDIALPWMDSLRSVFRHGANESHYNSLATPKGIVHFHSRLFPWRNEAGDVEKVYAIGRDISELRELIQKNDEQKALLLRLSDELLPLTDPVKMQEVSAHILGRHLGADIVYYTELNEPLTKATIRSLYSTKSDLMLKGEYEVRHIPGLSESTHRRAPYLSNDITADTNLHQTARETYLALGQQAVAVVPLVRPCGGTAAIVVCLQHAKSWTAEEACLVEEVARRTWDAVERATAEQALVKSGEHYRLRLEDEVNDRTLELKESKELLQSIYDSSLIQMSVLKAVRDAHGKISDFRITIVNRELERETGRADLVGKLYMQEYPGIKISGIFDMICRVVETGKPEQLEYFYPYDGFYKWFSCMFVKMDDGVVATNLDITSRKEAEEERLRNLVLLEQSEELANMGSWQFDLHSGRFSWSDGMYRLFNLPRQSPVVPEIYLEYATNTSQRAAERVVHLIRTGQQDFEETIETTVNGQLKILKLKSVVISGPDDQPARTLGVDMDITERVEAERKNRRLQDEQKRREEQKQEELMNMKLQQQREVLNAIILTQEQERERIGESLHNGLAQLLYGVQTRLQVLKVRDEENEKQLRTILSIVSDAINDARRITFELVPVVLKDYGIEVALKELIRKVTKEMLHVTLKLSGINTLPEKLEFAIYRIVQELLNNIVKHAAATEAAFTISRQKNQITITVSDNGIGFDEHELQQVGNGMGLKNIRNRVKLLKGGFSITSPARGGTVITITLPAE